MPLISYLDLEAHKNITLIEDGQNLANTMAEAVLAWAEKRIGRTFAKSVRTETLDGGQSRYYLSGIPIDTTQPVTINLYSSGSGIYGEPYTGNIRVFPGGILQLGWTLPHGYAAAEVTYTGGYDTLPADLKLVLVELRARKFDAATNGGTRLTQVKAIASSMMAEHE